MCKRKWLMIGICGVTCGGKTTLAKKLKEILPNSTLIFQDDYFLDVDDPRHTYISELRHINFDVITSLDMDKMFRDIQELIKKDEYNYKEMELQQYQTGIRDTPNIKIYIVEGFCIFNYKPLVDIFQLKYYFTLPFEECLKRRLTRAYDPPDCSNYFEKCAWPEYLHLLHDVKQLVTDVIYIDGSLKPPVEDILKDIQQLL